MSLKHEPALEPLHISAKQWFSNLELCRSVQLSRQSPASVLDTAAMCTLARRVISDEEMMDTFVPRDLDALWPDTWTRLPKFRGSLSFSLSSSLSLSLSLFLSLTLSLFSRLSL